MLKLRQPIYDEIRRHGEETYPDECCGALLGRVEARHSYRERERALPQHATDSDNDRYEIDPVGGGAYPA